jgi:putative FmdB family regulatory protein
LPTYEYQCLSDGHRFEVRHGINEEPISVCEICGGAVRRVVQSVGIVFKGSGFYATDSKNSPSAVKPSAATSDAKEKKADTPADTKAEAKQDVKAESKTQAPSEGSGGPSNSSAATRESSNGARGESTVTREN